MFQKWDNVFFHGKKTTRQRHSALEKNIDNDTHMHSRPPKGFFFGGFSFLPHGVPETFWRKNRKITNETFVGEQRNISRADIFSLDLIVSITGMSFPEKIRFSSGDRRRSMGQDKY